MFNSVDGPFYSLNVDLSDIEPPRTWGKELNQVPEYQVSEQARTLSDLALALVRLCKTLVPNGSTTQWNRCICLYNAKFFLIPPREKVRKGIQLVNLFFLKKVEMAFSAKPGSDNPTKNK